MTRDIGFLTNCDTPSREKTLTDTVAAFSVQSISLSEVGLEALQRLYSLLTLKLLFSMIQIRDQNQSKAEKCERGWTRVVWSTCHFILMFWPFTASWSSKRVRDEKEIDVEDVTLADTTSEKVAWPDLFSSILKRASEKVDSDDDGVAHDATTALKELDIRMSFFHRLSQEERRACCETESSLMASYNILGRTFRLPVNTSLSSRIELDQKMKKQRVEHNDIFGVSTNGSSSYTYDEEREKVESCLQLLNPETKLELDRLREWNEFDVFNVRLIFLLQDVTLFFLMRYLKCPDRSQEIIWP